MNALIDIGANLTHDSFDADRDAVIQAAVAAGVETMVITGSSVDCARQARDLAHQYSAHCFATAGIHPHHASEFNADAETAIAELLSDPKVVAVGETGLDFFRDFSPRAAQQFSFEQHIKLAIETGMPMFLHQRDAHKTFHPMLREHRDRLNAVVVHCFTDSKDALFDYLDLDCHIGITGWVCDERRGAHLHGLLKEIPANRLMVETDAPYLLPRTLQPKPDTRRNEPRYLAHIVAYMANILTMDASVLAEQTRRNARAFFHLPEA